MEHHIWHNIQVDTTCIEVKGEFRPEDVAPTFEVLDKNFVGKDYYRLLIDLSASNGRLSKESREALQDHLKAKLNSRIAFVITRPTSRMLAKVVVAVSGGSADKGFFRSQDEAWEWLKGAQSDELQSKL